MYSPGKIIYFDPFHFKNGHTAKRKYFIVLKVVESRIVLASLPTSIDHIPRQYKVEHGCLEVKEGCINCYIFEATKAITKCGWGFPMTTFMHGQELDQYDISIMESVYHSPNLYEEIGELVDHEFSAIMNCLMNSDFVKKKYIKMLES